MQFDAYAWFDRTTAVTQFGAQHAKEAIEPAVLAETYPFVVD